MGIVDPSGNPVSSGGQGPQVRAGSTSSTTMQGFQGAPPRQSNDQLSSSLDNLSRLSGSLDKVSANLEKVLNNTSNKLQESNKQLREMGRSLEEIVDEAGDLEDSFTKLITLNKKFSSVGFLDPKNKKQIESNLDSMIKKWTRISQIQGDTKGTNAAIKMLGVLKKKLYDIKQVNEDAFTAEHAKDLEDQVNKLTRNIEKMRKEADKTAKSFNNINVSKNTGTMFRAFAQAENNRKRIAQTVQASQNIKEQAIAANRERGIYRPSQLSGMSAKDIASMSGRIGLGGLIDRRIAKSAAGTGRFAGAARNLIFSGGGSGISGLGGGLLRGGGAIAEALGPLAAIADIYDMSASQNKKVAGLAGGGIFTGQGTDVAQRMTQLRANLMTQGGYLGMIGGQNMDKNIDILKTIVEGGKGIGSFSSGQYNIKNMVENGQGFYGTAFKNAIYGGSPVGLSQTESVKLTIDLIDKYKASLESVQGFFGDIDKTTHVAGISTQKYLQLVEDLGSHFDDMNRSLSSTVSILFQLGRSGRLTGDRMKQIAGDLYGTGNKDFATNAFLAQQMIGGPGGGKALINSLQQETDQMSDNITKALQSAGIGGINKLTGSNVNEALTMIQQARREGKIDDQTFTTLNKNLTDFSNTFRGNQGKIAALQRGDILGLAGNIAQEGAGGTTNFGMNLQRLQSAAAATGVNMNSLLSMNPATAMKAQTGPQAVAMYQVLQKLGVDDPQKFLQDIRERKSLGVSDIVNLSSTGALSPETRAKYYNALVKSGYAKAVPKGQEAQAMLEAAKSGKTNTGMDVMTALGDLPMVLNDIKDSTSDLNTSIQADLDNKQKEAQAQKAKDIINNTTTTAEIFAHSFEYLFESLVVKIGEIVDVLKHPFGQREKEIAREKAYGSAFMAMTPDLDKLSLTGDDKKLVDRLRMQVGATGRLSSDDYDKLSALLGNKGFAGSTMGMAMQAFMDPNMKIGSFLRERAGDIKSLNNPADTKDIMQGSMEVLKGFLKGKGITTDQFTIDYSQKGSEIYSDALSAAVSSGLVTRVGQTDKGTTYILNNVDATTLQKGTSNDAASNPTPTAPMVK